MIAVLFPYPLRATLLRKQRTQLSVPNKLPGWPMRRTLKTLATRAVVVVAILAVAGFSVRHTKLLDRQFIFFPDQELVGTPGDRGLGYEEVFFSASDGVKLHGWFVPGEKKATLLWFHGNAGNISHRLENLELLYSRLGVSVFIFDYRGYGRSEGRASEKGTYLDAEAAIEYLRSRQGPDKEQDIVLFGRSLGCAVAVEMATRHQVRGVILESPFTSIRAMGQRAYPYLPVGILSRLVEARYDSLSKIGEVHSPLMIVHGDRDETVPIGLGRELFEAANEPKRFYTIEGAEHNDTYWVGGDAYFDALKRFVENPGGSEG